MSFDQIKTTTPLHDLGEVREDWSGILSPMYADDDVTRYIHAQFLEDASHYVERYQAVPYWTSLLRSALNRIPNQRPEMILDVGSGAGNTIFALLELCPDASIVASDLSAPLLKSLKDFYDQQYAGKGDCTIVQLNAEDLVFEQDQFDLVVGGAILHHLFDPTLTLTQCYKVLKPGGCAIFFEPFEIGYQLLAIAIKHVLQRNPDRPSDARLSEDVERFFTALVKDIDVRKGSDKSAEIFQRIDDKWLFTQQFFESAARAIGFAGTEIYPIHGSESQFSNQMKSFMQLGLHSDINVAPAWAIETFVEMDGQFSRDLLPELIIEGCIILKK